MKILTTERFCVFSFHVSWGLQPISPSKTSQRWKNLPGHQNLPQRNCVVKYAFLCIFIDLLLNCSFYKRLIVFKIHWWVKRHPHPQSHVKALCTTGHTVKSFFLLSSDHWELTIVRNGCAHPELLQASARTGHQSALSHTAELALMDLTSGALNICFKEPWVVLW